MYWQIYNLARPPRIIYNASAQTLAVSVNPSITFLILSLN